MISDKLDLCSLNTESRGDTVILPGKNGSRSVFNPLVSVIKSYFFFLKHLKILKIKESHVFLHRKAKSITILHRLEPRIENYLWRFLFG